LTPLAKGGKMVKSFFVGAIIFLPLDKRLLEVYLCEPIPQPSGGNVRRILPRRRGIKGVEK